MNKVKDKFNKIKILIIGSGIIGKSNAFELSKYGFDIKIIEGFSKNESVYLDLYNYL